VLGISGIFALMTVGYLVCLMLAARFEGVPVERPVSASSQAGSLLTTILPPRELISNRRFLVIMGMTTVYNLWCFPFVSMVPVIAQQDFGLAPFEVGALSACDGIGGMVGALVVGAVMTERTMFRYHYFGTLAYVLLIGVISMNLVVGPTAVLLVLLGVTAACFSATQYALVYLISPPEMRGRATGVLSLFIGTSLVGHFHTGFLFERLGSVDAMRLMAIEGVIALLILGTLWWRTPSASSRA
jgi:predicted MFS family arabinose efflux permease